MLLLFLAPCIVEPWYITQYRMNVSTRGQLLWLPGVSPSLSDGVWSYSQIYLQTSPLQLQKTRVSTASRRPCRRIRLCGDMSWQKLPSLHHRSPKQQLSHIPSRRWLWQRSWRSCVSWWRTLLWRRRWLPLRLPKLKGGSLCLLWTVWLDLFMKRRQFICQIRNFSPKDWICRGKCCQNL